MVVVGFTPGLGMKIPKDYFQGSGICCSLWFLHHDVLHAYLDMVPCFLNDDWAERVKPCCLEWIKRVNSLEKAIWVEDRLQEVGRF